MATETTCRTQPFAGGEALVRAVCEHVEADPTYDDYVRRKYRGLVDPVRGRRCRTRFAYELGVAGVDLDGATVLDAGCGAGIYSLLMLARGASRILAFDYFPYNIAALKRITGRFGLPIVPVLGDVAHTGCEPDHVDFVYCVEAISHFHDTDGFLAECARILRPGGHVVIADGNNGANPLLRRRIHDDWLHSEIGPFTPDRCRPGENLPFLYRRWLIIRQAYPAMRAEDVFQLGMRTAGLGGDDLEAACRRFVENGCMPEQGYRPGMSQRRPEDGQRNEEPLDPSLLAARLEELGVPATARAHFGASHGPAARMVNRIGTVFPKMALRVAPTYIVHGTKRGPGH